MPICRTCGKVQDDPKMIGFCKYCEYPHKLIDERQYKLEQKNKCNHIIGLHTVTAGTSQGFSFPIYEKGEEITKSRINLQFKYCPLCGNKTRFYTKEK